MTEPAVTVTPAPPEASAAPIQVSLEDTVRSVCAVYFQAYAKAKAANSTDPSPRTFASAAFRQSLPLLSSRTNIQAFIACVTQALALEILHRFELIPLLNAAKVALAALPREVRPAGRPKSC